MSWAKKNNFFWIGLGLFILAFFLRSYRIDVLTEFLGDQGRAGLVIYHALNTHSLPLFGPTLLTGQHLGPLFYYLIGPAFILSHFNPVVPALVVALADSFAVVLLYYVGTKLFGKMPGFSIALLYAVSSYLVTQARTVWEPNFVPFFVMLLIFSFYKIYSQKKINYFVLSGLALSCLVQLHYFTLFLFLPTLVLWAHVWQKENKKLLLPTLSSIFAFLLLMAPFLFFQFSNHFADLKGVAHLIFRNQPALEIPIPFYQNMLDFSFRLFKYIIPIDSLWLITIISLIIILAPFSKKRNYAHLFFSLWFVLGLLLISLYKGVVFNHYLNFLVPLPFLLLGSFLASVKRDCVKKLIFVALALVVIVQLNKSDLNAKGFDDIARTKYFSEQMNIISQGKAFSFTLSSSRSFSDLHYRYFLELLKSKPEAITNTNYPLLFVICEKAPCDSDTVQAKVNALCYEDSCSIYYPVLDMSYWKLIKTVSYNDNEMYIFKRR